MIPTQGSHLHYNLNLLDDGVLIFSLQQHSMSPIITSMEQ